MKLFASLDAKDRKLMAICLGLVALVAILTGIFAREWVASVLQIPGDCFLLERMLRAGVRFAMVDQIVYDYYPSSLWDPADRSGAQH